MTLYVCMTNLTDRETNEYTNNARNATNSTMSNNPHVTVHVSDYKLVTHDPLHSNYGYTNLLITSHTACMH